jgi:molybdate transport system permease protein
LRWRGKALVETFVAMPLVLPPVVTGLILLKLFGRRGPIGHWLYSEFHFDIVFTWRAVTLALAVMSFPLLVWTARSAIEEVNPALEQIARTLGAGEWRVFITITLPLAKRGLLAGTLLAFARALGEFGATILVAGNIPGVTTTLSTDIYQLIQLDDDNHAWTLAGISLALAFAALWISVWLKRRGKH